MRLAIVWIVTVVVVVGGAIQAGLALADDATEINVTSAGFVPIEVQVAPGETLRWVNETDGTLSIVGEDGRWESGDLDPGETFSIALREPGTYAFATEDGAFEGTVIVAEDDGEVDDAAEDGDVAEDGDDSAAALPETGAPLGALLAVAAALVLAGAAVLWRGRHARV